MAGCPLENPRDESSAVPKQRILSDEKFVSPRQPDPLALCGSTDEEPRGVGSGRAPVEAVELSEKPSGFFVFFKGKRPILGNLKESHIIIICLLVDFWGGIFFKLTRIMIWCCGLFADWLERCVK